MPDQTEVFRPGTLDALGVSTLPDIYEYAIDKYSDRIVMNKHHAWGYQSIPYQEFGKLISFLGSGLISRGLEKGGRVALMAENSPEWIVVYAAVTSSGGTIVPLDINIQENELRHILLHCEAQFLIVSPKVFSDLIEGIELEDVEVLVMGGKESGSKGTPLGEVMAEGKTRISEGDAAYFRRKAEVEPGDTAAICYTSGTTGRPKGAVLLHSNIVSNIESIKGRVPISESDTFLCILPLHHTFSSMCVFLTPLFSGSTIVFARSIKPKMIIEDIMKENVTILVGVPLLFEHLAPLLTPAKGGKRSGTGFFSRIFVALALAFGKLFRRKKASAAMARKLVAAGMGNVRYCVTGAAAIREDVEKAFFSAGLPLLQGYGLTEASPVVAVNPVDSPREGTVGPPLPGIEIRIDRPDEEGVGEILVKGPNVMKEYYRNPEATSETLSGGYLYTGDLGILDESGYLRISGRKKTLIVTAGGKNIHPDEIEMLLNRSEYILESVVLPVEDRKGNTRPGAVIVPNYDTIGRIEEMRGNITEERIREFIGGEIKKACEGLPDYKKISEFRIRDEELPKTTTRKVKRHLVTWTRE